MSTSSSCFQRDYFHAQLCNVCTCINTHILFILKRSIKYQQWALKTISNIRGGSAMRERQKEAYQSLLTNNQQPTSSIYLSKPHFLIEGAIPSHHHGDLVIKSPTRYIRRRTQNRCCLILQFQEWLKRKKLIKCRYIYIYIKNEIIKEVNSRNHRVSKGQFKLSSNGVIEHSEKLES